MLVLSRKAGQALIINGDTEVRILGIDQFGQIKIGITAPEEVSVYREEIQQKIDAAAVEGWIEVTKGGLPDDVKPDTRIQYRMKRNSDPSAVVMAGTAPWSNMHSWRKA